MKRNTKALSAPGAIGGRAAVQRLGMAKKNKAHRPASDRKQRTDTDNTTRAKGRGVPQGQNLTERVSKESALYKEALKSRLKEFQHLRDYEQQVHFFLNTLNEVGADHETAYAMLTVLHEQSFRHNGHARFEELLCLLERTFTVAYSANYHQYACMRLTTALATNNRDGIPDMVPELASIAEHAPKLFSFFTDQLIYYGMADTVNNIVQMAWVLIEDSVEAKETQLNDYSVQNFKTMANSYALSTSLERLFEGDERALSSPPIQEADPEKIEILTGKMAPSWSIDDFVLTEEDDAAAKDNEDGIALGDDIRDNLELLTLEFEWFLRKEKTIQYMYGEMVRTGFQHYIESRHNAKRRSMQHMLKKSQEYQHTVFVPRKPQDILSPDAYMPVQFTMDFQDGTTPQHLYRIIALFQTIPAWMEFLESRQLIDAKHRTKTLALVRDKLSIALQFCRNYYAGADLLRGLQQAWEL